MILPTVYDDSVLRLLPKLWNVKGFKFGIVWEEIRGGPTQCNNPPPSSELLGSNMICDMGLLKAPKTVSLTLSSSYFVS